MPGDTSTNQNIQARGQAASSAVSDNVPAKVPSSPWEDDVDIPETPPKNKPTVVGSFAEPAVEAAKPFSVPQNVSEPVGKKISAVEIINQNQKPNSNIQATPVAAPNNTQTSPPAATSTKAGASVLAGSSPNVGTSASASSGVQEKPAPSVPQVKPPVGGDVRSIEKTPASNSAGASGDLFDQIDWFGDNSSTPPTSDNSNIGAPAMSTVSAVAPTKPAMMSQNIQPVNSPAATQSMPVNSEVTSSEPNPVANSLISNIKSRIANNKNQPVNNTVNLPKPAASPPAGKVPQTLASGEKEERPPLGIKKILLFSLLGVLFVVIGLIALNELGVFSVGFEKVYGAIGLEKLWGGLSESPENALAISAVKMEQHPNFKMKGNIVLTINSSIKSEVTDPLVSAGNSVSLSDQVIAMAQKAILTQANPSDSYNSTDSTSTNTTTTSTSTDSSSSSTTTTDSTPSSTPAATSSPIKSVTAQVQFKSTNNNSEADLSIGNASFIVKNQQEKLFVNGSKNVSYGGNTDSSKWVEYDFSQLKDKVVQKNVFDIKTASGYSAKGTRVTEEVVGGVRCYKYNLQSLEIGNSLSSIGISSDSIQSISGDVWIGIRDKLIRKISLNIIPSPSFSVTSIQADLEFYDFNISNTIGQINSNDLVAATSAYDLTTIDGRDSKRKADVKSLLSALKQYKAAVSSYPVSASLLNLSQSKNIIETALVPQYLSALPTDPKNGWYYAYKSDGGECSISARLENQGDADGQLISNVLLYLQYNNN